MKYLLFIITISLIVSCKTGNKRFPFTEEEMVQNKMYGELLEYAMLDTTKIDFANDILCDTLKKNEDLIFSKIITEIDDSSYYFFHVHEYEPIINDYIGMLYVDINKFDSIYMYCFDNSFRYSTTDFINVIEEIAEHNKTTIEETIKHSKINNNYIPHFYFVVMTDYSDCESGFIEDVVRINNQIDSLMNSCSAKIFDNEKVVITPYVEITNRFLDIYQSRQDYYPPPAINDEEILNEINKED